MERLILALIAYFPDLLDINLTASVVILFIICVRQLLKRAPKIFSYALWLIVLLRLLVPFSIESPVSFVPERTEFSSMVDVNEALPEIQFETPADRADNQWRLETTAPGEPLVQTYRCLDATTYLTFAWLAGMAGMTGYSIVSYWKLRRRVRISVPLGKGIRIADDIDSPFVMGFFRPVIYLPGTLEPMERKYIIAHERHHIRRGDHIFKILGFLALTVHWFNPLVWLAFVLASRDMEMSCDEAVIQKLGEDVRADYSATLLNLATGHRLFAGTPLAFGEGDPTGRVRNLAKWKKPAFWVVVICSVLCAFLAVCLLTDPEDEFDWSVTRQEGPTGCVLGDFNYTTPEGLAIQGMEIDHDGNAWDFGSEFYVGDTLVGGLILRYQDSEKGLEPFTQEWEIALGIPQALDETMSHYGGSSSYADYEVTYFHDGPRNFDDIGEMVSGETEQVTHYYFLNGDDVYDLWFYDNRLSGEIRSELLNSAYIQPPTEAADFGVAMFPERVSRTGATATFVFPSGVPTEGELTYGGFLSLDRLVGGEWIPVEELPGFEYYVGDSSYPVADGYGMVHEWPDRFGELPDGTYRMGKLVTCHYADGTTEDQMVYGQFALPNSIQTEPIPLEELPEKYSGEQAMIDGCFVATDGAARENGDLFHSFVQNSWQGTPGFIRIVDWHYGDNSYYTAYDLEYDGSMYTLTWLVDGQRRSREFPYIRYFFGENDNVSYEHYVLIHDEMIDRNIWGDMIVSHESSYIDHMTVFSNYTALPTAPQIPSNLKQAVLEFEGEALVTTTDFDRLEKLYLLFTDAEFLGYEPKTHSIGVGLNLVLTEQNGVTVTIELDPDSDICRIDGEFVFYGAPDEPDYIEKLWYYLGIDAWPDQVYEKCPNALRP